MRVVLALLCAAVMAGPVLEAHTRQSTRKAPARTTRKVEEITRSKIQADWKCASELGTGVTTGRKFCDVLTGTHAREGVLIAIPPHRGKVTLTFELHNRHTYSAELVKLKRAYRKYTATIGVLTMDNTLIDRAVVQSEFRTEKDLFDRIAGGAGPGGVKAVAPSGNELIAMELPDDVEDQVSVLGEKLAVMRPDGSDSFTSAGRPIASISNVFIEYNPAPPPRKKRP